MHVKYSQVDQMANAYGTEGRLLEELALNDHLSVSQLAKASGLSYPTTLYKASTFPFVTFEKVGREKRVKISDEQVDAVYPFLIALQTSRVKKAQLTMAFLCRKGLNDAAFGGELALESQLPVKDAEPNPEIEIRTRNQESFKIFLRQILNAAANSDFTSNSKIIEDPDIAFSKKIGLLHVSTPEKLLVDAIVENQSKVYIENIAEAIVNSRQHVDLAFLRSYAMSKGVLESVLEVLRQAEESGFP
jgi:hypothetical protein